jgi:hypothetical protein
MSLRHSALVLEEECFTDVLISKAGSNHESVEALDKSQACPLITWLVGLEASRHVDPNRVS